MSKLFEALRKTEGSVAEIAMSVLGDQVALIPEAPVADQLKAELPTADLPKVELPKVELPKVELPKVELPKVELPKAELPNVELPKVELPNEAPKKFQHPTVETTTPSAGMRKETIRIAPNSPVLPFDGTDPHAAEQYKIIRTKIRHHPQQPKLILVSSPMPGDGKTISSANVAGALALQENLRVLLVDCDFRRASLTKMLGLDPGRAPGLGEVLRGEASIESAVVSLEQFPNLYLLPQGDPSPNPAELLSTTKWQELITLFRRDFGFAVFDAPPVGTVADYDLLQLACDGVVLIARPDHTNRQLWRNALVTVPKAKQMGVILNCVEDWFLWKNRGYYYYSEDGR